LFIIKLLPPPPRGESSRDPSEMIGFERWGPLHAERGLPFGCEVAAFPVGKDGGLFAGRRGVPFMFSIGYGPRSHGLHGERILKTPRVYFVWSHRVFRGGRQKEMG